MLPDALLQTHFVFAFEFVLSIVALALVVLLPEKFLPKGRKLSQTLDKIARREKLSIVLVGVLAFTGSMAVSLIIRFPEPAIHDEFSYLLAADTFASGRLTNPAHPMWRHFESIHIIQQPTYASKYPPAQGAMLALGQVLGGHPAMGVWLGIGIACASICWMLQGWIPARWALFGGLIAALNLGFFGYWSQKYWGGAVAATGGALIFGALRRLLREPTWKQGIIMGVGLIILANSRPLEGLITSLPVAAVLLGKMLRCQSPPLSLWSKKVIAPLGLVLILGFVWMGYYNYRVTGKPWQMPYQIYESTLPSTPLFIWSSVKPVKGYPPQPFLELRQVFLERHARLLSVRGFIIAKAMALVGIAIFFLRWVFLVPLLLLPSIWRNRWHAFALLVIALVTLMTLFEVQTYPRKVAPVTCLIILVAVQCWRCLRILTLQGKLLGRSLAGMLLTVFLVSVAFSFFPQFHAPPWPPSQERAALLKQLHLGQDRHLILVRYGPDHFPHFEWVYNEADIDAAQVVWARELDEASNRRLMDYFEDRKIWLLEVDRRTEGKVKLVPYPLAKGESPGSAISHQKPLLALIFPQ
jgi:hypothetical protein